MRQLRHRRLNNDFVEWIDCFKRFPVRKAFLAFCTNHFGKPCGYAEFAALRRGDVVREHVVVALANYLLNEHPMEHVRKGVLAFGNTPEAVSTSISTLADPTNESEDRSLGCAQWPAFHSLFEWALETESSNVPYQRFALANTAQDVSAAALLIIEAAGFNASQRSIGRVDRIESVALGERRLKRSVDTLTHTLLGFHKKQNKSIALLRNEQGEPVAAAVTLSLSKDTYDNVRTGRSSDDHITAAGLEESTGNIFLFAAGQIGRTEYCGNISAVSQLQLMHISSLTFSVLPTIRILFPHLSIAGKNAMSEWGCLPSGGVQRNSGYHVSELDLSAASTLRGRVLVRLFEWMHHKVVCCSAESPARANTAQPKRAVRQRVP
jgi:hypothetical protein